ncbi:glycoside hydrolase superfamily [Podospora appendiculata]|uniref:Glycoside hydrolase superfamily n=1 Tax=Podospora appendiculata TaxID=314037 RepID=A0AAE1CEF6_9PEZI|nr:glycoside hydrolase superfamily [Podospora appendiculata]
MFLRWDAKKWETEAQYTLDVGFNTVRLEGKNEHPEFFETADRLGLMVLAGWECCDKWEAWSYNNDLAVTTPVWTAVDYVTANASMIHEAAMLQTHPSVLAYLVGSDYWPDDTAAPMYVNALKATDWQMPVITSASKRSYAPILGPGGMKMDGPYDWVPPNYWYDTEPSADRLGAAFGFGSEQGAGVGTPDLSSLKKFLSQSDLDDLWKNPNKDLFHMSSATSSFHNRKIYNTALWKRWGAPSSLDDYVLKAQITDYEANRAEFEGFAALWNAKRPATGVIYWMLTGAFPSLHWNIWDYYQHPAGGYFGAKVGSRVEHVAYDYVHKSVYLINRSLDKQGARTVDVQVVDTAGKVTYTTSAKVTTTPNTSKSILSLTSALGNIKDVVFLRLVLSDPATGTVVSRNVYWVSKAIDTLDWPSSEWYVTPVTKYSDYTALNKLATANVSITAAPAAKTGGAKCTSAGTTTIVTLENLSTVPAFFIALNLVDSAGRDVLPVTWTDNYVTLLPKEKISVSVSALPGAAAPVAVLARGKNIPKATVILS